MTTPFKMIIRPVSTNEGFTNPSWKKKDAFSKVYTWAAWFYFAGDTQPRPARIEYTDYCGRNTGWKEIFSSEAESRTAAQSSANRAINEIKAAA